MQSLFQLEWPMSSKQYRPWNPDQLLLFPPAMRDALDDGHIVFRIMDVVGTLNISCVIIVEPVFGHAKEARGFRRFSLRGLRKVASEWTLVCLCGNLLKLVSAQQAAACP